MATASLVGGALAGHPLEARPDEDRRKPSRVAVWSSTSRQNFVAAVALIVIVIVLILLARALGLF